MSALRRAWAVNEGKALNLATRTSSRFRGNSLVWDDNGEHQGITAGVFISRPLARACSQRSITDAMMGTIDATKIAIAASHTPRKILRSDAALAVLPPGGC